MPIKERPGAEKGGGRQQQIGTKGEPVQKKSVDWEVEKKNNQGRPEKEKRRGEIVSSKEGGGGSGGKEVLKIFGQNDVLSRRGLEKTTKGKGPRRQIIKQDQGSEK